MNKARKFKTLDLLNFEGPVLKAHRVKNIFVITDQWKAVVDVLIGDEMEDFINGDFSIVDSKGKSWLYTNESADAKSNDTDVSEFIKL
jgi:hypothetical protein